MHYSGVGEVSVQKTGEILGSFRYQLTQYKRPGSVIWSTDASIDLDFQTALMAITAHEVLTLTMEDGRLFDFFVQRMRGPGEAVDVTAAGGIRDATSDLGANVT